MACIATYLAHQVGARPSHDLPAPLPPRCKGGASRVRWRTILPKSRAEDTDTSLSKRQDRKQGPASCTLPRRMDRPRRIRRASCERMRCPACCSGEAVDPRARMLGLQMRRAPRQHHGNHPRRGTRSSERTRGKKGASERRGAAPWGLSASLGVQHGCSADGSVTDSCLVIIIYSARHGWNQEAAEGESVRAWNSLRVRRFQHHGKQWQGRGGRERLAHHGHLLPRVPARKE